MLWGRCCGCCVSWRQSGCPQSFRARGGRPPCWSLSFRLGDFVFATSSAGRFLGLPTGSFSRHRLRTPGGWTGGSHPRHPLLECLPPVSLFVIEVLSHVPSACGGGLSDHDPVRSAGWRGALFLFFSAGSLRTGCFPRADSRRSGTCSSSFPNLDDEEDDDGGLAGCCTLVGRVSTTFGQVSLGTLEKYTFQSCTRTFNMW